MKHALRALVVEDDRSWQQILRELLSDSGLQVDLAVDLKDALEQISKWSHRLAVVDLSLVASDHLNRDGLKVLKAIRQRDPDCITILLTGFATVEIAVSALTDLGVYTCLRKEMFHRGEFRELVKKITPTPIVDGNQVPLGNLVVQNNEEPLLAGAQRDKPLAIVVEDDAGWREIFSELLIDAGFQVRICQSFGEALGCFRRESYRLAVVDLSLDGTAMVRSQTAPSEQADWEGYRLLASMRSTGIPAVVVSGVANAEEIERVYQEHGIFSFIEKRSFDRRVFLNTILEAAKTHLEEPLYHKLTTREKEVLEMLSQGLTNKEIAEGLFITSNTVKRHLKSIFEKLQIHTRSAAAAKAVNWFGVNLGDDKKTN